MNTQSFPINALASAVARHLSQSSKRSRTKLSPTTANLVASMVVKRLRKKTPKASLPESVASAVVRRIRRRTVVNTNGIASTVVRKLGIKKGRVNLITAVASAVVRRLSGKSKHGKDAVNTLANAIIEQMNSGLDERTKQEGLASNTMNVNEETSQNQG